MPDTTVQKITSVITMEMSLMNASPSGFSATPVLGRTNPTTTASAIATSTCAHRLLYSGGFFDSPCGVSTLSAVIDWESWLWTLCSAAQQLFGAKFKYRLTNRILPNGLEN